MIANVEAEQFLLGMLLAKNDLVLDVSAKIKPEAFSSITHQRLFSEILRLVTQGKPCNAITMDAQWADEEELYEIGDARTYLAKLEASVLSLRLVDALDFAEAINISYRRKRISEIAQDLVDRAGSEDPGVLASAGSAALGEIVATRETVESSVGIFDKMVNTDNSPITPTGYQRLDSALEGGLWGGKFYCFAARMKSGKTTMLSGICYNVAKKRSKVLYLALEMGKREIMQKIAGRVNGCSSRQIAMREINTDAVIRTRDHFAMLKMDFEDAQGITNTELIVKILDAANKGYNGVIFDYIQLLNGLQRGENEASFQARVAQGVAEAVKKTPNMWVLTAAQLNRDGELRGSDGVRMAADWLGKIETCVVGGRLCAWIVTEASRYTASHTIGSEEHPAFMMNATGTAYEEI